MTGELGLEDIGILAFCRGELCVEWVVSFNGCKRDIFFTPMHGLLSLLGLALTTNSCSSPSVFNEVQVYVLL